MSKTSGVPAKRIRVLHIITNLPIGGAQDNTLLTVEKLDRNKFEVGLLSSREGGWVERACAIPDLKVWFVDELVRKIHPIKDIIALWKIYHIIRKGRFDIVHTHSSKPGFSGRIAARLAGVPIVIHTIHGFPFNDFMPASLRKFYVWVECRLSRITDVLITVSQLNLEKAWSLKIADRSKFRNIYSGIDFDRFDMAVDREAIKRDLGIENGQYIVGTVGRLSVQKAPLDFVRAIPNVLVHKPDVRFIMVGDGELKEQTLALAKKLKVDSKLSILGFRKDIPELLQIFDVFVLTSLWEGLGRSLTEAMYSGRPIVATSVEGVPELVKHDETGLLARPRDTETIAEGIVTLLTNADKAKRLGTAARNRIDVSFKIDRMVDEIEKIYDAFLKVNHLA